MHKQFKRDTAFISKVEIPSHTTSYLCLLGRYHHIYANIQIHDMLYSYRPFPTAGVCHMLLTQVLSVLNCVFALEYCQCRFCPTSSSIKQRQEDSLQLFTTLLISCIIWYRDIRQLSRVAIHAFKCARRPTTCLYWTYTSWFTYLMTLSRVFITVAWICPFLNQIYPPILPPQYLREMHTQCSFILFCLHQMP